MEIDGRRRERRRPTSRSSRPRPAASPRARSRSGPSCRPGAPSSTIAAPPWRSRTSEQFRILFLDKRNALIADEVQQIRHRRSYAGLSARGRQARARALGNRADPGPQSSLRRPDALRRRHRDDPRDHRHRATARHRGARSHHRRPRGPCEPQGAEADLGRSLGPRLRRMI